MRRNLLLLLTVSLFIAGLTVAFDRLMPAAPAARIGEHQEVQPAAGLVPDFIFTDMRSGKERSIADLRGKVVLLNFWASWCAPCVIEFPKLRDLTDANPDIVLLAVSADSSSEDVRKFMSRYKIKTDENLLVSFDPEKKISQDLFQTIRLPETIIIDPQGRMVRKVVGDTDWTGETMKSFLSDLAAGHPIP